MKVQDLSPPGGTWAAPAPLPARPQETTPQPAWSPGGDTLAGEAGPSVLERLQSCNPHAEIWWDSSPLDFPAWRRGVLAQAADAGQRARWDAQLDRFLHWGEPRPSALVRGVTTNPALISKSVHGAADFWRAEVATQLGRQQLSDVEHTFWSLYQEVVHRAATAMLPVWRASAGRHGWVSGQLDPRLMFDADRMLEQAWQLAQLSPNLMIKVPGTRQGYEVVRRLTAAGVSTNGTLSYTVPQFTQYVRAVEAGLADGAAAGADLSTTRAVVTHMIGRLGAGGDLSHEAEARGIPLSQRDVRWAEVAVLKRAYRALQKGRHPVKLLLSSLEADAPAPGSTSLSMHLEESAGADVVYTCKPSFVTELMRREAELEEFRPNAIDEDPPSDVVDKLERLPSFRRAIDPAGMAPDEFPYYGPFVSNQAELLTQTRRLLDFTARALGDDIPPA